MKTQSINETINELSSAVTTNGNAIIKILELIDYQNKQIDKLKKEIQELKSKLQ
jgi:hypothetical protein